MNAAEKITSPARTARQRKSRRWMKRQTHRAERREAKKAPEDAPKKRQYRGWWD